MVQVDIEAVYKNLAKSHQHAREELNTPLTLAEKILWSHVVDSSQKKVTRGKSFIQLNPDRVAMQDATAQMAILQFIQAGVDNVALPVTIHCDHLIRANTDSDADLKNALNINNEVYEFLSSAAKKYGMGFWKPGSGIIHQIVLENYAFPGGLMIGTDSHTPNAGGMGMAAIGVGGADAVDVMLGMPWEVLYPQVIGVKLTGSLNGWTSGKDIILKLLEILTVKGGSNKIVEYFGPGVESLSCTAQATATNMGAELGATCSVFPFHSAMADYLRATKRADIAKLAEKYQSDLQADPEVMSDPAKYYDEIIEVNLSELEPYIVGPHTPDAARPVSTFAKEIKEKQFPEKVSAGLIGSCTNSSYEDLGRSAHVAKQAVANGIKFNRPFIVSPGSSQVNLTAKRDGLLEELGQAGATFATNSCGPCIGQWDRKDSAKGTKNAIVTSFNRNFPARNDGNPDTLAFIASPEIVTALSLSGKLGFNPLTDTLEDTDGNTFKLSPPEADTLPKKGYLFDESGFVAPAGDGAGLSVNISPESERLQFLPPFEKWDGNDFKDLPVLAKVKGKCTTDHISPAGPWLKFRGHLDNISNNMLTGANSAFTDETGKGKNVLSGDAGLAYPDIARQYKSQNQGWIIIGDENYGEGSSREHAAMSPRFLGAKAVITRSIARIHETNLKKQGVIPLCFVNNSDYDLIQEDDKLSITGLKSFAPGKNLTLEIKHANGSEESVELKHSFNQEQINWFKAGSALNLVAK
ncbi:MAG: aconitate hydratase [Fibrobacteria bacterium]|nr:aconitate hydratase [Fibrobacteria bacterium]